MIDFKNTPDEDKGFGFDMKIGPLTLTELILIVVGFGMALTVLMSALPGLEVAV